MKKVPFELFGEGQYLYFNIARLMQLEQVCGTGISKIIGSNELNLTVLCHIFSIGLAHHKKRNPLWYAQRIQELLDDGISIQEELYVPAVKAIAGSGILGKAAYYGAFPEELTAKAKEDVATEEKNV
jgi:hypothetical protein